MVCLPSDLKFDVTCKYFVLVVLVIHFCIVTTVESFNLNFNLKSGSHIEFVEFVELSNTDI